MSNRAHLTLPRPCNRCKGAGEHPNWKRETTPCTECQGTGQFTGLNPEIVKRIIDSVLVSRGPRKGKLLKSAPHIDKGQRAYFVWRMTKFHGGIDVCMPMLASMMLEHDPFITELNEIAKRLARLVLGNRTDAMSQIMGQDMSGGARWRRALGRE